MHPKNIHNKSYDFQGLSETHPALTSHVFVNGYGIRTIDFSDKEAVFHLNKAILMRQYHINDWHIPKNYLCPPIPGRADYIYHLNDLVSENNSKPPVKGLDIGVGASCIYPILGARLYNWQMVGCDIHENSVKSALENIEATPDLKKNIEIRHQKNNAHIFEGIINTGEQYHFTMCNPPFHASEEEAVKLTNTKMKNLGYAETNTSNFGGQANELWCNGGEALFIKRMIKQSVDFKNQVGWFTSLVSKSDNLPKIQKQIKKTNARHKIIEMSQGNKKSRIVAWTYQ
ncbi:23S rRNA (adenine(1618)-N(6))-methyltransferase RlmF [Marixanthomonas spongiae]|uniref:Ribosomal RNA large subunit methyltransferase F n=1 Tax=Marixanthomonas spongiae TaxID=2174845 RepID=A0A2U0I3F6_9FLAO|nr:23S rRNA (adenine(1618)-N(6))-methyltransferase RlmF [Marixanthomonas spongiae]PVW15594.1 23S rRNA (adenine(1618)-N(6))-methyltransferase RlmF [Marixanthomonas spongiae]